MQELQNGCKIDIDSLARERAKALAENTALPLTGIDEDDIYNEMLLAAEAHKWRIEGANARERQLFFSRVFALVRKDMLRKSRNALRSTAPARYAQLLEEKGAQQTGTDRKKRLDELHRVLVREELHRRAESSRRARRLERFDAACELLGEEDRKLVALLLSTNACKAEAARLMGMSPRSFDYAIFQPFARRFRRAWKKSGSRE